MDKFTFLNFGIKDKSEKIICKNYKNRNLLLEKADENGVLRLYEGDFISPIDFVFKTDKNNNIVSCFNRSSNKMDDEYYSNLTWNERFLVFVNQQAYLNASKYVSFRRKGIDMDKDGMVRDFSEVMVYQWMEFFKTTNYLIPEEEEYSMTYKMAEATILSAISDPYRFYKNFKRAYPDYIVGKRVVYSCYDPNASSLERISACNERRMLDKLSILVVILSLLDVNTVSRFTRLLKNGKAVWNYEALTKEYNARAEKVGFDKVQERTIRNYIKELEFGYDVNPQDIIDLAVKAMERKRDKRNRRILSKVDVRGVSIGRVFVDYHGTRIHVSFNDSRVVDSYDLVEMFDVFDLIPDAAS